MRLIAYLIAALTCLVCQSAFAEEPNLQAQHMERLSDGTYSLEGQVRIEAHGAVLEALRATYDQTAGTVDAQGDVRYSDNAMSISAGRLVMNLQTREGTLYAADVTIGEQRISGHVIRKVGQVTFIVDRAEATSCQGTPPAWCISGRDVQLTLGQSLSAWHSTFDIRGVPVFYMPYVWLPILSERTSGLLMPRLGWSSRTGASWSQPLYLAISPNRDATLWAEFTTSGQTGQGLEYRAIEGPRATFEMRVFRLHDSTLGEDFYETSGAFFHAGGPGKPWASVEVNAVNRTEFYRLHETELELSTTRYLESRAWAEMPLLHDNATLHVAGRYVRDLMPQGQEPPWLLPGLMLASAPIVPFKDAALIATASHSEFHNDASPQGRRTSLRVQGSYALGQALVLSQHMDASIRLYESTGNDPAKETLGYASYAATVGATFDHPSGRSLTPLLRISVSALDGTAPAQFDALDSVADGSELALVLEASAGDAIRAYMEAPYSLRDSQALPLRAGLNYTGPMAAAVTASYDPHSKLLTALSANLKASLRDHITLGLSERYDRAVGVDILRATLDIAPAGALSLGGSVSLDSGIGEQYMEEARAYARINAGCWALQGTYIKRPDESAFYFDLALKGLGHIEMR